MPRSLRFCVWASDAKIIEYCLLAVLTTIFNFIGGKSNSGSKSSKPQERKEQMEGATPVSKRRERIKADVSRSDFREQK